MRPADTSPEAWKVYLEIQRGLSAGEKLRLALQLSDSIVSAAAAGLRRQFPAASDREVFLRGARRRLGRELFARVYGSELTDDGRTGRRTQ
jgi:hypothetical protein